MSRYTIDDIDYVSPSEFLGMLEKGAGFYYWIGQQAIKTGKPDGYKEKRDQTADLGSEFHHILETYINNQLNYNFPKIPFTVYAKNKDNQNMLNQMFYQYQIWEKHNVKRYIASEHIVVNTDLCYAGTCDLIYEDFNGKVWLIDFKTKNALYGDEKFQISAYKLAREKMSGDYVINCNANGKSWTKKIHYEPIKIDCIGILLISRDFFEPLQVKDFTDDYNQACIFNEAMLTAFYSMKKRRMNNYRAKRGY